MTKKEAQELAEAQEEAVKAREDMKVALGSYMTLKGIYMQKVSRVKFIAKRIDRKYSSKEKKRQALEEKKKAKAQNREVFRFIRESGMSYSEALEKLKA